MAEVNMEKLEELAGKVVGDVAGAMGVFMSYLGDQAGVFEAIDEAGPVTGNKTVRGEMQHPFSGGLRLERHVGCLFSGEQCRVAERRCVAGIVCV